MDDNAGLARDLVGYVENPPSEPAVGTRSRNPELTWHSKLKAQELKTSPVLS